VERDWDGSGSDLPTAYGLEVNNLFQKALKGVFSGRYPGIIHCMLRS
jgi:hypothetical protein